MAKGQSPHRSYSITEDLPDFDVYCVAVEFTTQHIRRLVAQEADQ